VIHEPAGSDLLKMARCAKGPVRMKLWKCLLVTAALVACRPSTQSTATDGSSPSTTTVQTTTAQTVTTETAATQTTATAAATDTASKPDSAPNGAAIVRLGTKLPPVDEASKDPSFVAFRDELRKIVRARDTKRLLAVVDPKIRASFGPDNGIEGFRKMWKLDSGDSALWLELGRVLELGGSWQKASEGERFVAPYVFANWPESADAFESLAAVCPDTIVRESPDANAKAIARLQWHIVTIAKNDPRRKGDRNSAWRRVVLPDEREGWVESNCLRGQLDYRAGFEKQNGKWRMTYFVAGD
jgi:hypothetical protein